MDKTMGEIMSLFDEQSARLRETVEVSMKKLDMSSPKIVGNYFQIIQVSSIMAMMEQHPDFGAEEGAADKVREMREYISVWFNGWLHPLMLGNLEKRIRDSANGLRSGPAPEAGSKRMEDEAKQYNELRAEMSTKEFVEQYDAGLEDGGRTPDNNKPDNDGPKNG